MSAREEDMIGAGCAIAWGVVMVAGAIGWVMNIAKIAGSINEPVTAMLLFRLFGVVAFPLGGVLGWF